MNTEVIIDNIMEKKLDDMKQNINTILAKKASEKLDEIKSDLASNYFKSKE